MLEQIFRFPSLQIPLLLSSLFLNSCNIAANNTSIEAYPEFLHSTVSANFATDGRLWRLIPTKNAVYVDYSSDQGKTYSSPLKINKQVQKISAWPENPPSIEISKSGRINILYYADEQQKSTSFYSYSDDNGKTFSTPTLISDHAQTAMHYMDKMLIDDQNKLYIFWHDTRHETHALEHQHNQDNGALSLYYSVKRASDQSQSQFQSQFLSAGICSCCRTAAAFSATGQPVILARMVYDNGIRDHALLQMNADGSWQKPQRVTFDNWSVDACPEHGPSLTIDDKGRTHFAWFTLGDIRQGIFYAQTDSNGKTLSNPLPLGNNEQLPSHPDIITLDNRVVIVWKQFDGQKTSLHIKESNDRGLSWKDRASGLSTESSNSHPKLISNNSDIFLSWTSKDNGHQLSKL